MTSAPVATTPLRFKRLLLTGAAGGLGRELRQRLPHYCDTLRLSDIADLGSAGPREEVVPARLEDAPAVLQLLEGVDAVVHLGGVSTEQPWEPILQANIVGLYNLYEAARKQGVKRVLFASSNHVTGFYRQDEVIDARDNMRFNDGRTDRQGRFWAGTMVRDMGLASDAGALYRWDERGLVKVLDGFITPNGLGFSPDGRTMYLSDSHPSVQKVWAFDLDDEGTPHNRRLFVDFNNHLGRPDGAAVDAEGAYWICANDAGLVHRFTPDGRLDRSIAVPVAKPAMCAFGGAALDSLFVTSIRPAAPPPEQAALAGALFIGSPGARGLPDTPCRA